MNTDSIKDVSRFALAIRDYKPHKFTLTKDKYKGLCCILKPHIVCNRCESRLCLEHIRDTPISAMGLCRLSSIHIKCIWRWGDASLNPKHED